ncbi:MAG: amidohydrolase family protein, partial [Chloroflexi bacterium]|nr:amidohydrolase family protein [Chloroflexota bacterium]
PHLYGPQLLQTARVTIGMDRVLFGTDYPLMPQEKALDYVAEAGLTNREKEKVLGGNAVRLLGLSSP